MPVSAAVVAPPTDSDGDTESWRRFRLIADNASDVVCQTDVDGVIEWISPTVTELLGWYPDDVQGVLARSLVHPDDLEEVNRILASVYDGAAVEDIPCRFRTRAGDFRVCAVRARLLLDAGGAITGSVVALRDTHEKAAALRALTTLSRGNAVLVRADDELGLLQQMCDTVVEAGEYVFAWYGRAVDDETKSVAVAAISGTHGGYLEEFAISWEDNLSGQGTTGRAIRTRTTQVVDDFETNTDHLPWREMALRHGFRSTIALPVLIDGRIDGALMVYAAEARAFDLVAHSLLDDLAADLGYGLARLRDSVRLAEALSSSVFALAAAVESRDPYTAGHQSQVGTLSEAIGRELGLDDHRLKGLVLGASIHDLGKIAIDHEILATDERLTPAQWEVLRRHPDTGYQIVGRFPWPWPIAEMIRQHHERIDGSGYPRGLVGDDVLLEARIIAVADTFDAMAHERPYRRAPGVERARAVLAEGRGVRFDADVVDALERVLAAGFELVPVGSESP